MTEALVKAGAAVDQAEADGVTSLYIAAQNGHLAVVGGPGEVDSD